MTDTLGYTILAAAGVIALAAYLYISRYRKHKKIRLHIKSRWANAPEEEYSSTDMSTISRYFYNYQKTKPAAHFIDDITWNDLDMNRVFNKLNHTLSTVGDKYLYRLLREPVYSSSILHERDRLINFFRNNPLQRERLQFFLALLGKKKNISISDYFYNDDVRPSIKGGYLKALAAAFLLSPLLLAINISLGIMIMILLFIINMTTYHKMKNEIAGHLEALSYIVNLIEYARKIAGANIGEVSGYLNKLGSSVKNIKGLSVKSFYSLFYRTQDPFLEYVKVVLLGELIAFDSFIKIIGKHKKDLDEIFEIIGMLDSLIAVASYRESLSLYTTPGMSEDRGSISLKFEGLYHPLIKDPVANSAEFDRSALITGSNASGKSTFLKTIAINAIFAQTIYTCLAKNYSYSYFIIYSSMALKDDLANNESYYIVEIKSLKRIFDGLNEKIPCLCLIDEVLRGTNTVERISASSEVLHRLSLSGCLCIAATHDIELTSILGGFYDNYHFQEQFTDNDIIFDYKLYPGKSNSRNAIKLLKYMGYEEYIVKTAENRAMDFLSKGSWDEII